MRFLNKITTVFSLIFLVNLFTAQEIDQSRFTNVLKQLNLDISKIHKELCTEKKMPNAEDSYIIIIPVLIGKFEYDSFSVKNTILITNSQGIIKNKFIDPIELNSDAVMLQSFTIDTGLYNLNSNVRAFGLTAYYRNGSQPNPYSSSDISLYFPEGKTLKKILDTFNLNSLSGEWDTNCNGEFQENVSVIILDKNKTNGFTNLKIKTENVKTINKEINGDCKENKTSKTSYKTLKFNKSVYK